MKLFWFVNTPSRYCPKLFLGLLAWKLFKHYSNHKTHTFSHCLKESWAVLNKGRKALQTAKAKMQVINGESFPIIRGNEPLYSWEMKLKNLKPVDFRDCLAIVIIRIKLP